jgi:IclR family transcriptional regulator, KDG regulon repressor
MKNKVVVKSMNILELFGEYEALSINEMVEVSKLPKSSVTRMVNSLIDMGFLSKRPDRKYELGLMLLYYGQLVSERIDIRKIALPLMEELRDKTNEAVNLALPEENGVIYVEKVDVRANQMIRVYTRIGRQAPYYAGAAPKLLLAYMDAKALNKYLDSADLSKYASKTLTDRSELIQVLDKIKSNGYSISYSELVDGAAAIAAPIRDHNGDVIAALSITGPESRFRDHEANNVIEEVIQTANEISKQMGWQYSTEANHEIQLNK